MSSEAQVALIVGVISAVSALAGVVGGTVLGWWLNRRNDRRTEKRAAYIELLSAMDACQHQAIVLHTAIATGWQLAELQRQRDLMNQALGRVDTAVTVASLTVRDNAEPTIRAGMAACIEELAMAEKGETYESRINPAYSEILILARQDLN